ncbi:MAG TPA: hypothetical protein VMR76_02325 [Candidatus Saccharimonadia bacterium]|nr:hypothetical protein [Candidatus Saccharimonadia bacterium]
MSRNDNESSPSITLNKRLKRVLTNKTYKSTLKSIRKTHRKSSLVLSKLIHAKGMDNFNELLIKTLASPRAFLGAAVVGLLGTTLSVYVAEIYSYHYNYLLFVYMILIGYVIGLVLELLS